MTFRIETAWDAVTVELTTDSASSRYGIPTLRITADGETNEYGPADVLDMSPWAGGDDDSPSCGAELVCTWAKQPGRTAEEIEAAKSYLRQWPDYPLP